MSRDSIAAYGFSAGGYLAAQIGVLPDDSVFETSEYANRSSRISAVVTLAGLFDFTGGLTPGNRERIARFLNGANTQSAQVVVNVSKDDPPFLLLHGRNDQNVPTEQSARLEAVLRRESVPVQTIVVANAEHGLNPSGGNPVPSRQEVSAAMARFIQDSLEGGNTDLVPINTQ